MPSILILFIGATFLFAHRQQTTVCRQADSFSAGVIQHIQKVVTATDAGNASVRAAYKLPLVTTSPAVELVTDENQCLLAKAAVEARYTDGTTADQVYLLRIGTTRFVATDGRKGGRDVMLHVFDTSFQYLITIE